MTGQSNSTHESLSHYFQLFLLKKQPRMKGEPAEKLRPEVLREATVGRPVEEFRDKGNYIWCLPWLCGSLWLQEVLYLWGSIMPQGWLSWGAWQNQSPTYPGLDYPGALTERCDDGAGDAVGHDDSEDAQHPGIHGSKLVLEGLVLGVGSGDALIGSCLPNPLRALQPGGRGKAR